MTDPIDRREGRRLFGLDPLGYDAVRPAYPDWIFDSLVESHALRAGAATLEIGPGSGAATRRLIASGVGPLTLVEPDERFLPLLENLSRGTDTDCSVVCESFEAAALPPGHYHLVVAATSFHWIDPRQGLRKVREVLIPGGSVALIWNVFQDLDKADAFHDATKALLAPLSTSPSGAPDTVPFALDRSARETEARDAGFERISYTESRWSHTLSTREVGSLYEGFSSIQRMERASREKLLGELMAVADERFHGRVVRNMTSCLYLLQ